MTFDTIKKAISIAVKFVKEKDLSESIGIIFFGGEPLLKRDLICQTVEYCKKLEESEKQLFHYKITTNGLLLDKEFLSTSPTDEILVALSYDGIKQAHDKHRKDTKGNGTFERLSKIAELVLKYKPYAPVMMVVTPQTVKYFARSVEFLFNTGFHYIISSLNYGTEWNENEISELKKQYNKISKWYLETTLKEEKFYFSPFEVKIASHIFYGNCKSTRCELGLNQISVAPDGKLFPCVQFVGNNKDNTYLIGDVDNGIDEKSRMNLYKLNAKEKKTCLNCAIKLRCNHYCGCLNKQATGRIDKVSHVLCAHEQIVLPIADRLAEKLYKNRNPIFIQKHYNELFPLISLVEDNVTLK